MSPGTARKLFGLLTQTDVRHVLPAIRVPTLILHRVDDKPVRVVTHATWRNASLAQGTSNYPDRTTCRWWETWMRCSARCANSSPGNAQRLNRTASWRRFSSATSSTRPYVPPNSAITSGRDCCCSFYAMVDEKLHHFRGRKLDTAGDGLFAAFDGPARAVRCGAALVEAAKALGLQAARRRAYRGVRSAGRKVQRHRRSPRGARCVGGRPRPGARHLDGERPGRGIGHPFRRSRFAHAQGRARSVETVPADCLRHAGQVRGLHIRTTSRVDVRG